MARAEGILAVEMRRGRPLCVRRGTPQAGALLRSVLPVR